jgi:hypothetical protein
LETDGDIPVPISRFKHRHKAERWSKAEQVLGGGRAENHRVHPDHSYDLSGSGVLGINQTPSIKAWYKTQDAIEVRCWTWMWTWQMPLLSTPVFIFPTEWARPAHSEKVRC